MARGDGDFRRDSVEVYALVGAAGTGKSHRALLVARQYDIPAIIDDGLLIEGNKIRAGRSAKGGRTRMEAVRLALFYFPDHAREVVEALDALAPPRVLILGTSRGMIHRICEHLGLSAPVKLIDIADIAAPEEIQAAQRSRQREGKHVIPAPTFEVKRRFAQQLVAPLRLFYRFPNSAERVEVEKSVVRPAYTSLGRLLIAERAIRALFEHLLSEQPVVAAIQRCDVDVRDEGIELAADVTVYPLPDQLGLLRAAQRAVKRELEAMTAVAVLSLDLTARSVLLDARGGFPWPAVDAGLNAARGMGSTPRDANREGEAPAVAPPLEREEESA